MYVGTSFIFFLDFLRFEFSFWKTMSLKNRMEKEMRRLIAILLALCTFAFAVTATAASPEMNWSCIRNGNKQPPVTSAEKLISQYGGYWVDRRVSDKSDKRVLYLTFDVGYENGNTERILNTLKDEGVPAAFFILDNIVLRNSELVTRMANEGHLVCNHTKNHKNICRMSTDEVAADLGALESLCLEHTGVTMAKYFRFPEGRYSEDALKTVCDLGYKSIFWSFAYADWDNTHQPSPDKAIKKVLANTHNGAVILLHPTSSTNAAILPQLIESWRAAGYTFGTLDDLTN